MTIEEFVNKWWGLKGGAERSNLAPFITDLCQALELPLPGPAQKGVLGAYEYEGTVPQGSFRSLKSTGYIDLYKRGCFVLEAKQSQIPVDKKGQPELFDPDAAAPKAPSGARYDKLMRDARAQAEHYAHSLPGDHPNAPFVVVCDIGRAFEILFDYSGNGRGYAFFPDKKRYRIELPDLLDAKIADRLRAIWIDPRSIDPRFESAEVTREVAKRLAEVSQHLEEDNRMRAKKAESAGLQSAMIEETALFLMRVLFCMFAEDVGLLPKDKFKAFLEDCRLPDAPFDHPNPIDAAKFERGLKDLWHNMGAAHLPERWSWAIGESVRYFNGGLFEEDRTYPIHANDLDKLIAAARAKWDKVEPAIFGTLLEQALTKAERAKLGAHYTPRPYVERLVQATIMDVLEAEWQAILSPSLPREGEGVGAERSEAAASRETRGAATSFHTRIASLRILDPACGTGNFLYVAMEALQRLEADVIETIQTLGGKTSAKVGPHQFHGLELNPRAAKIAELVLWIGWLRFRISNDPEDIPDPVLARSASINFGRHGGYDAVLARTESGEPDYKNPHIPAWPEADFIIGNPPFIGGKDLRDKLGSDYAEALWKANARVPKSADFVMQWWDRAAHSLTAKDTPLKRFGFVTTNSITQEFSRRVIAGYLEGENPLSLVMAVPDHPWTKASRDAAAVRIAMTVAEAGEQDGCLMEVTREAKLDSDEPDIVLGKTEARIFANLDTGVDVGSAKPLLANEGLSSRGVVLHGAGFIITPLEAKSLGLGMRAGIERHIRPYRNGRDLLAKSRDVMVIDLYGLSEKDVRLTYPEIYQHVLATVKPERDTNRDKDIRENWWVFGRPRSEIRPALDGLNRYIATVETAKHRVFQFIDASILPDNKLLVIALDDPFSLGIFSSTLHMEWSLKAGGWIGMGNDSVYVKSKVFDPFPFPDATPEQVAVIADLAEELDATRKILLSEVPKLTMTELYNLRAALKSGDAMDAKMRDRAVAARAAIIDRLHEQIDQAVADAYGWGKEWRQGALAPSEIVARLVALNAERAAEEKAGTVRWLRPDYQIPRFAP